MVVAPLSIPSSVNFLKRRIATIPPLPVPSSHGTRARWRAGKRLPYFWEEEKIIPTAHHANLFHSLSLRKRENMSVACLIYFHIFVHVIPLIIATFA